MTAAQSLDFGVGIKSGSSRESGVGIERLKTSESRSQRGLGSSETDWLRLKRVVVGLGGAAQYANFNHDLGGGGGTSVGVSHERLSGEFLEPTSTGHGLSSRPLHDAHRGGQE